MKTMTNYSIFLLLSIIISPVIKADHTDEYSLGESIAKELEGVRDSFTKDIMLYKQWTETIQILDSTIDEHDALRKTVFTCVKEKFKETNEILKNMTDQSEKDKKKSDLKIKQLEGHIITLEISCKKDLEDIHKKYEASLKELKAAQDLLETLVVGHEERGKEIQNKIMETRQEYVKMIAERTALFNMLTNFSSKLKSFNYTHYSGLQELANDICNQVDKIEEDPKH